MANVFLNGRFLHQPVTGVQRFCTEVVAAIDHLVAEGEWPDTVLLAPRSTAGHSTVPALSRYRRVGLQEVGRMKGHLWEQAELFGAARGGVLVSLGNTAPVLAGRRQVVVIHDAGVFDTPESYSACFRTWYRALQHRLARAGAKIATVSEFSRRRIVERLHLDPDDVLVTYEGADHILRTPADPRTLERYGLRPREYALVVSNRVAHKNHQALRGVAALLERRGKVLAIVGAADPNVFQDTAGFGFAERRLNRVSDAELRALYDNAICLLFPSRYEGFGLPPVEAMACGCPVIAARGGAVEEICADNVLYFSNGDETSLVRALEQLLDDGEVAARLRARGRERAALLSWDASARVLGDAVRCVQ